MRYPKGKRAGVPFFTNALGTYYGKDNHVRKKSQHLAKIIKDRAQNSFNAFLKKNRIGKRTEQPREAKL